VTRIKRECPQLEETPPAKKQRQFEFSTNAAGDITFRETDKEDATDTPVSGLLDENVELKEEVKRLKAKVAARSAVTRAQ
jgi:translation initiation factor 1 (eIF-1/SUI1)